MDDAQAAFFAWMRAEMDYSVLTAELYVTLLGALQSRTDTLATLDDLKAVLPEFAPSSRHNYRQAWRAFRYWKDGTPPHRDQRWARKKNRVELLDDGSAYLWATNRAGEEIAAIRVDQEDLPVLRRHRWSISYRGKKKRPYVITQESCLGKPPGTRKVLLLHRFLVNPAAGLQVDHIDGDPFDNRKSKLRAVTKSQQMQNARVRRDSATGHRNVYKTPGGKWKVQVLREYIGTFAVLSEAVLAAAEARSRLFTHHNESREGNLLEAWSDDLAQVRAPPVSGHRPPKPMTYRGTDYPSIQALARDHAVVSPSTARNRLRRGWAVERALTTPSAGQGRPRKKDLEV